MHPLRTGLAIRNPRLDTYSNIKLQIEMPNSTDFVFFDIFLDIFGEVRALAEAVRLFLPITGSFLELAIMPCVYTKLYKIVILKSVEYNFSKYLHL